MSRAVTVRCDRCFRPVGRDGSVFSAKCEDLKTILHNVPPAHSFDLCLECATRFVEFIAQGRAEAVSAAALVGASSGVLNAPQLSLPIRAPSPVEIPAFFDGSPIAGAE